MPLAQVSPVHFLADLERKKAKRTKYAQPIGALIHKNETLFMRCFSAEQHELVVIAILKTG